MFGGNGSFLRSIVEEFARKLSENGVTMDAAGRQEAEALFYNALQNGEISEGGDNAQYVSDVANELAFARMINGVENAVPVSKEEIQQLISKHFGTKDVQRPPVREEPQPTVKEEETTSFARFIQESVPEKREERPTPQGEQQVQQGQMSDDAEKQRIDALLASLIQILQTTGELPKVPDGEKKESLREALDWPFVLSALAPIAKDESILFAYYSDMAYVRTDRVKQGKNGTLKIKTIDNKRSIMIVTERRVLVKPKLDQESIILPKSILTSVNFASNKKLLTLGQIQLMTATGSMLIADIRSQRNVNEQFQFDRIVMMLRSALAN